MVRRSFPHRPESVSEARRFVAAELIGARPDVSENVQLLVSELATNALLYSSGVIEVSISRQSETQSVRVEVTDVGSGEPRLQQPEATEEHGRGLQLVDSLAEQWGVKREAGTPGKTVWFELRARTKVSGDSQ